MNSNNLGSLYSGNSGVNLQSTTHKRSRSESEQRFFDGSLAPPLPRIANSDVILQVFTHRSLRRPNSKPEQHGDNERLAELGKAMLDVAITDFLFRKRPFLQATEISRLRKSLLSTNLIDDWVTFYGLRKKMRCHPSVFPSLQLPQETDSIFHAYVGGLFVGNGLDAVNEWIDHLLAQEVTGLAKPVTADDPLEIVEIPPSKRAKSETMSPSLQPAIFFASQPPPSPPRREPPPHLPRSTPPSYPNPLAPAQPDLPFLPLFNQAATQRRVTVDYVVEFIGPPHAGRWCAKCVVNELCKGVGYGNSKQMAKEEAARQAYYSMGWT
ncbi:ribonuclease III domain-containing protein [Crassisporium funariophilum]|nr:ribonuclease III domain-containing protein [Crassisporium funariophilum]